MPTNTYVALDTKTIVGSSTSSITFSSIPQGYTDLVIVEQSTGSVAAYSSTYFNGNNTGTNYSWTYMFGTGGSAVSGRVPNLNRFEVSYHSTSTTPNAMIYHVMNYSNSTTFKTMLSRYNLSNDGTGAYVGLWRQTSAITSITFESLSGTYTAGSTFTIYGIAASSVGAKATGGTIYSDSLYYYHAFTGNGTFTPTQSISADVLVVAGGGGGASGGGGAGGIFYATSQSLTTTNYTCTVGAGGNGGSGGNAPGFFTATNGVNSSFGALTAAVGGGFGAMIGNNGQTAGANGGSGGAGGAFSTLTTTGGSSTQTSTGGTGYGSAGGANGGFLGDPFPSGGGGGAGGGGANATSNLVAGNGGVGLSNWSTWLSATGLGVSGFIAGGGGGSTYNSGTPGTATAGGGNGSVSGNGTAGRTNTGGGGGAGAGGASVNYVGGAGGSGIVIVRYLKA